MPPTLPSRFPSPLLALSLRLWCATHTARTCRDDRGQTTAEYGLVILAAGTLALAVILWARSSDSVTGLFESVIQQLTGALDS